jgi:Domain of unknown function (DUF4157)
MNSQLAAQTHRVGKPTFTPITSGLLQRCNATAECDECCKKRESTLQRAAINSSVISDVPPIVYDVLRSPGQSLGAQTRAFMESRFGHDFSDVQVHTDTKATQSAQAVNALAYTVGRDVVFSADQYAPMTSAGLWTLAHELTHVVQQNSESAGRNNIKLNASDMLEDKANTMAWASINGSSNATFIQRSHVASPMLMRLTPDEFRRQLGATPEQKSAIQALFGNKTFLSLWDYLKNCPAKPKADLGPLNLKVSPGLKIGGVERYGGYDPGTRTLEINPTKPEHRANPTELVDTITHELIHALDALQDACQKAGSPTSPLAGAATVNAPKRAEVAGTAEEQKLMIELGPGASNPCEEFIDINKAAQQMIIQILRENIQVSKVGRPTITFVNEILRRDPNALKAYKACRDVACAKPTTAERNKAIAVCSADILSKFMPQDLEPVKPRKPTLAPPTPDRPKFGPLFQPRKDFNDKIIKSAEEL